MKNLIKTSLVMLGLSVLLSTSSFSLPGLINYQGRLTDSVGNPITNTVEVTFTLWSAESGGSQLGGAFSDADMVTPDADGIYSTLIGDEAGDQVSASVFENDGVWLNVNVAGEDLTPRTRITSVGASLYAETAGTVDGLEGADLEESRRDRC